MGDVRTFFRMNSSLAHIFLRLRWMASSLSRDNLMHTPGLPKVPSFLLQWFVLALSHFSPHSYFQFPACVDTHFLGRLEHRCPHCHHMTMQEIPAANSDWPHGLGPRLRRLCSSVWLPT
jgi:hypothetical protein